MHSLFFSTLFILLTSVCCINFPYESIQLTDEDVGDFSAIAFGDSSPLSSSYKLSTCKAYPGTPDWPADDEWSRLNSSLGGALLQPAPAASVCYNGPLRDVAACNFLLRNASSTRFYLDNPLAVLTEWPQGDTCLVTPTPQGVCTQGGFPVYVVNATTVRQIQIAVNFARNKNIRLVIKNTGHDFEGRSVGAGSLSIWTHHLKSFEFLPQYRKGEYDGRAARVGAGLEAWELYPYMDLYEMAVVVPAGSSTIGVYGGFMAGGGHSVLASYYGLGSDQALSLQVVTADGRFVTADPHTNKDLFHALRGGGPATYGIVTSAIVKAYPRLNVGMAPLSFLTGSFPQPNNTGPPNPNAPAIVHDIETFWRGVNMFFYYGKHICDVGGTAFSYVSRTGNNSFSFTNTFEMPGMSSQQVFDAVQPLFDSLNAIGIQVNTVKPVPSLLWAPSSRQGKGDTPNNLRFASRLFPRRNWGNKTLFEETMAAIRESVEAGYTFHGIHISPTEKIAGYPGHSGVNPAFRTAIMHADSFYFVPLGLSAQEVKDTYERHKSFMDKIRAVTPGAGAYINEADVLEPNWQQSFFGSNYPRLLEIKKKRDPWGVFWAPTTPGSEAWQVKTADGLPTQNGPLCKVEQ